MKKMAVLCLLLLNCIVATAYADVLPERLALGLQKMETVQGFSCQFEQHIVFADDSIQHYQGTLAIRRPGKFRWQYYQPYEQLFVSQGKGVWHYEVDLMQAQWFADFDTVDPVVMQLLDGRLKAKDVQLLGEDSPMGDVDVYHLQIRGSLKLSIALTAESDLRWLESVDVLGNRNRIVLMYVDKALPKHKIFDFTVPDGVDIVDAPTGVSE